MNLKDLRLRVRALLAPRRVERELDDELAFHIACEIAKLLRQGVSPAEARARARARFGSVALAADECRDARGIGVIDSTLRDVRYAFRTFRRAPLAALTIVATMALGLGLVTVVFTLYNAFYLQKDAVRNPDELFAVERPPTPTDRRVWIPFTRSEFEALRRDTSVFTDVSAMVPDVGTRVEGRTALATLVTGNYFQVLGVHAALGRTLTPSDDEPFKGQPVVVLSHRGWTRLFGADPSVIGRTVSLNGAPYEVVGVMQPAFRGLGAHRVDCWMPLSLAGQIGGRRFDEDALRIDRVVGRLKPGMSPGAAAAGLNVWAAGRTDLKTAKGHPAYIRLRPSQALSPDVIEGLKAYAPIFFAFGLVLMIGCANVANLLLARAVARQREIGIRLSLGASRRRIIRQLLTESLLLASASAVVGFVLSRIFLETATRLLMTTVPLDFAYPVSLVTPAADWRVLLFLAAVAVVSTVFFGLMPAIRATRLELVRTMRGELTRDARPDRARQALIAVQVSASALLLICAAVFLRGAFAAAAAVPAIRTGDTVMVDIVNEPLRDRLLQEITAHPLVTAVAASSPGPMGFLGAAAASAPQGATAVVPYQFVSPEYFGVLDLPIIQGRGFSPEERTPDSGVVIVSEDAVRKLWLDRVALGRLLWVTLEQPAGAPRQRAPLRTYTVVGVARSVDSRMHLLGMEFASAGVYLPTSAESAGTSLTLRVHGDPERARQALMDVLTRVDPALPGVRTLKTMAGMDAYLLRVAFWVTLVVGALALLLTSSGLFSVLSYLVEQRRQEIGVRMALGATARDVAGLVLSQMVRPLGAGLAAGGGLAAALAIVLMSTRAASRIGEVVRVLDPVSYIAGLLIIVTACVLAASVPALRAARIDPIATLKQE